MQNSMTTWSSKVHPGTHDGNKSWNIEENENWVGWVDKDQVMETLDGMC